METLKEFMTTSEAADYLGCSRQWLEMARSGGYGPPYIKPSDSRRSLVRYCRSEIHSWMLEHQRNPNPTSGKE